MNRLKISLLPLQDDDREQFIRDNQEAFNYGAMVEFGLRDNHFEEDGEIISRATIEESIDNGTAFRIMQDGQPVGGVIVKVEGCHGNLRFYLFPLKLTAKELVMLPGLKLNECILSSRSGRP